MRGRLPVTGTYTGTGTAITLPPLGFKPKSMTIYNDTDAFKCADWVDTLADAAFYKTVAAGTQTKVSSNGITVGANGAITIGTDSNINTNAKVYNFICY